MPYIYIIYNITIRSIIYTIEYITTNIQYYITILSLTKGRILINILYIPFSTTNYLRVLYNHSSNNIYNNNIYTGYSHV